MINEKNRKMTKYSQQYIERRNLIMSMLNLFCKEHVDDELLGFTQTFKQSSTDGKCISKQHEYKSLDVFMALSSSTDFIFLPEVHTSGLKYGSIHYHGILKINKPYKWFNKTLPFLKKLGFTTIKPIFDLSKWKDYLIKDFDIFLKMKFHTYLLHTPEWAEIDEAPWEKPVKEYVKNI